MRKQLLTSLALGALLVATIPGLAAGQSSPSAVPVEAAAASSLAPADVVRVGWTLYERQQPAVSVQLPTGWQEVIGDALFAGSGPSGETLELAAGDLPEDDDFDAYVARLEKSLEKSRKQQIPTTFRATSSGLVGRLDQAARKSEPAGTQTSLFLFPTCDDGTRTLTFVGAPPEPTLGGSPDAWDEIAASVNPCAADAAPELVLSPEVLALGGQYLAVATEANAKVAPLEEAASNGPTVNAFRRLAGRIATVLTDNSERVDALPWTEETRPLADAYMAASADQIGLWTELSTARNVRAIESRFDDWDRTAAAKGAAARAIRLATGLPSQTR